MMKDIKPRSLKRILIETVIFSFLLALLFMYNIREDKNIADNTGVNTELVNQNTKTVSLF